MVNFIVFFGNIEILNSVSMSCLWLVLLWHNCLYVINVVVWTYIWLVCGLVSAWLVWMWLGLKWFVSLWLSHAKNCHVVRLSLAMISWGNTIRKSTYKSVSFTCYQLFKKNAQKQCIEVARLKTGMAVQRGVLGKLPFFSFFFIFFFFGDFVNI